MTDRLEAQFAFLNEADRLKSVLRAMTIAPVALLQAHGGQLRLCRNRLRLGQLTVRGALLEVPALPGSMRSQGKRQYTCAKQQLPRTRATLLTTFALIEIDVLHQTAS